MNAEKNKNGKKIAWKYAKISLAILGIVILAAFIQGVIIGPGEIQGYKKEYLPSDLEYTIQDESVERTSKNQITVYLNEKLTKGQLAFLAEKLYDTKPKRRRFYMFYLLPGMKKGSGAWAITHFDPNLEIQIIGSIKEEDVKIYNTTNSFKLNVIGKWSEQGMTNCNYVLLSTDTGIVLNTIYRNGEYTSKNMDKFGEIIKSKIDDMNGEYYIINDNGNLDFYNKSNSIFTTAFKIK